MDELVQFRLYLVQEQHGKRRKRSLSTVTVHIELLKRLLKHCPALEPGSVVEYLMSLYETGRKGNYLNSYIDTLHLYGRFKQTDIYESLKYFPEEDYEKATMSDDEIEKFLSLSPATNGEKMKRRWKIKTLFWKCLAYSGARPGEIAHLTINTVDLGRQVFLLDGKTGKRIVPIAPVLVPELTEYIKEVTGDYLFPSLSGRQGYRQNAPVIDDVDWHYDFHQRLKRLGIKRKNLTPYSLRHSFITRLLNEDLNIYKVQNLVGHKQGSPVTSQYYHLTTKALFKTLNQDPLQRHQLPADKRFEQFRLLVRQALSDYCLDHSEESSFLKKLVENFL